MIYLGPPADERAADRAASIVGGLADGAEKALGAALDYAADFIAPPPPPTKEQIRQMESAEEEAAPVREAQRSAAEHEAKLRELLRAGCAKPRPAAGTRAGTGTRGGRRPRAREGSRLRALSRRGSRQSGGGETGRPHPVRAAWDRLAAWILRRRSRAPAPADPKFRRPRRERLTDAMLTLNEMRDDPSVANNPVRLAAVRSAAEILQDKLTAIRSPAQPGERFRPLTMIR